METLRTAQRAEEASSVPVDTWQPDCREPWGGTYVLLLSLAAALVRVGRLGEFAFPAGYYAYVGSALGPGGLQARIRRHMRPTKRKHWHIDYLLPHCTVVDVLVRRHDASHRLECEWAQALLTYPDARVIAPRFGASDCRCPAHLIFLGDWWENLNDCIYSRIRP